MLLRIPTKGAGESLPSQPLGLVMAGLASACLLLAPLVIGPLPARAAASGITGAAPPALESLVLTGTDPKVAGGAKTPSVLVAAARGDSPGEAGGAAPLALTAQHDGSSDAIGNSYRQAPPDGQPIVVRSSPQRHRPAQGEVLVDDGDPAAPHAAETRSGYDDGSDSHVLGNETPLRFVGATDVLDMLISDADALQLPLPPTDTPPLPPLPTPFIQRVRSLIWFGLAWLTLERCSKAH
jgi:hypothetical protein